MYLEAKGHNMVYHTLQIYSDTLNATEKLQLV
jgi:hypothetical protein